MSTGTSIRKAFGAIKDTTSTTLVKINSDFKDIDLAVVKATNHVEAPPKEKHVRTIFAATSASRPRADVAYTIHALAKRLQKTHNWAVALKTLMVVHRTLREGDPTFREELINFSRNRGHILNMSNFKDDSSPVAWDYSAWVRTYALFLEERLECCRVLKYDVEHERSTGFSKTRELDTPDLLEHLPALQQLLFRLMGCQPEGAAVSNHIIQAALGLVLKESFKLYRAINDGIINLVDKFFEMQRHDATKALEIYKRAGQQAERLQEFYDVCKNMDLARSFQFPTLEQPPQSFLATMEDYVKDAPRAQQLRLENGSGDDEYNDRQGRGRGARVAPERSEEERPKKEKAPQPPPPPPPQEEQGDLLGLDTVKPMDPAALEDANAMALAIVPPNGGPADGMNGAAAPSSNSWELALVPEGTTAPTPANINERKLAGGFDKLILDSLYEDAMSRRSPYTTPPGSYAPGQQQAAPGMPGMPGAAPGGQPGGPANPFQTSDPFRASQGFAPPSSVQMANMQQQQAMMMQQQQMMYAGGGMARPGMMANPFGGGMGYAQPGYGGMPQQQMGMNMGYQGPPQPGMLVPYQGPPAPASNNPFGNPSLM